MRNDTPNVLVFTDDAGTDTVLGAGGGGGADVSVGDLTGGNWKVVYSSGAGVYQELALGASGTILTSNGAASAPSWDAAAGGGNVSNTGTPVNDQVAVFTNATTVEGTTGLTKTTTAFTAGNYVFNTDQTVGAGQDNYVLTYDNASGEIGLEAAAGGGGGGTLVSKKVSQTQTATTGTTVLPFDATIPQNTEGDEKLTVSITPADSANTLVITCSFFATHSSNSQWMCGALFQDTTADALASCSEFYAVATEGGMQTLIYTMAAGTTSSTTFKLRVGSGSSGTTTFNRSGATLTMGGKLTSIITVEEFT